MVVHVLCLNSKFCVGRVIWAKFHPCTTQYSMTIFSMTIFHFHKTINFLPKARCKTFMVHQMVVHVLCLNSKFCVGRVIWAEVHPCTTQYSMTIFSMTIFHFHKTINFLPKARCKTFMVHQMVVHVLCLNSKFCVGRVIWAEVHPCTTQ